MAGEQRTVFGLINFFGPINYRSSISGLALGVLLGAVAASHSTAQDSQPQPQSQASTLSFAFEGGSLGDALFALTDAYDINIIADDTLIQAHAAPAVSDDLTAEEALERILVDSGLTFQTTPNGAFVVVAEATDDRRREYDFAIAEMPLAEALDRFRVTTQITVDAASDLIAGQRSRVVAGTMTAIDALELMVSSSDLAVETVEGEGFVLSPTEPLERAPLAPLGLDVEEVVVTANRVPTPINQIARTVTVIREDQLNTQLARTADVGDLLGVLVPGFGAPSQTDTLRSFTLRGRDPQYLIDGVPLQFNGGVAINESPLTKFDPQSLGRIEVLYGPTALYGAGAPGGVIQFFTKDASTKPVEVELRQQFNSYPDVDDPFDNEALSWKSTVTVSGTLNNFEYVGLVSYDSQNAILDDDGDIAGSSRFQDELTYFAKLRYRISDNQRVQFTYNFIETEADGRIYDFQFGDDGLIFGRLSENQNPFQWSEDREPFDEKQFISLVYDHDDVFGGALNAMYYDRDEEIIGDLIDRRNAGFPLGDQKVQSDVGDGWRIQYSRDLGQAFSFVIGADYDDQSRRANGEFYFLGPDFDETRDLTQPPIAVGFFNYPADVQTLGAFVQAEYKISDQLRFSGGFRYEDVEYDVEGGSTFSDVVLSVLLGSPLVVRPGISGEAENTAYNLGVNYELNDQLTLYGNFAQAFELNDVRQIPALIPVGTEIEGSRFIEPQKVDNYEFGLRGSWRSLGYSFAAYRSESDFGTSVFFDPDTVTGGTAFAPKKIEGFEATLDWFANDSFNVLATYSWSQGEVDFEDDDRGFVAIGSLEVQPWKATLLANYSLNDIVSLNFQALIVGDRDEAFEDGTDPFEIDGYHSLDAGARFTSRYGVFDLQVTNLLNESYLTAASQTQLGVPALADRISPARGRNVSLVYTLTF